MRGMKISGGGKHRTSLIQFASQYRVKKQNREKQREEAYEKTVGEIDPISNVGPDSPDFIAGDHNRMAPTSMRLRNGKIMVKRDGVNAVLHLLYSGAVNRYANMLLLEPWRELEAIWCVQGELESGRQRQRRLDVFPMSDVSAPNIVILCFCAFLFDK